ncbi:PAS domain-containing sensor histidine kinase [Chitinimonas sp.]|uniref:sensor histidine kinase n=1 Tax=Chitinimonas sp. TaxID=1934313 RepID=UPI0035B22CD9
MGSESNTVARIDTQKTRQARILIALAAALLTVSAALAGANVQSPRLLVSCALLELLALLIGGTALARLQRVVLVPEVDLTPGLPAAIADLQALVQSLETQLDHAPVALWRASGGQVDPVNTAARRLLAPGSAAEPEALRQTLLAATSGKRQLIDYDSERGSERAVLAAAELTLRGEAERLLALMPIESELEAETLAAWRQLVHVLTHEIMNSLTPIASLSRTAQDMLADLPEVDEDLRGALDTIARRASHLAEFVAGYRSVSQLPAPQRAAVKVAELLARLEQLVGKDWQQRGGSARFAVEPASLELMADAGQLEQALLNLIKNAADATAQLAQPRLEVLARLARGGRLVIEVMDNGPGVPDGMQARIFTPFFTTKEHGLGVGLALVRNLVHGMGGTVRYAKRPSGGACFVLAF